MKKTMLYTLLALTPLFGEVITLTPFVGNIIYDTDNKKSIKDSSTTYGLYTNIGTLDYLLEFNYAKFTTKYKTDTILGAIEDLNQDDITLAYGHYFKNFMLRGGFHYVNTNDLLLGNGAIAFTSLGGYNFVGYDKYSYGVEAFYSYYSDGRDDLGVAKSIAITQLTPYFSAYNALSLNLGNLLSLKLNYQITGDYSSNSYLSYEISDTLYYKSLFLNVNAYTGEMRTAVRESGFMVVNTLDLMKYGYGATLGYYFTPSTNLSLSYSANTYREYLATADGTNSAATLSLSYKF